MMIEERLAKMEAMPQTLLELTDGKRGDRKGDAS